MPLPPVSHVGAYQVRALRAHILYEAFCPFFSDEGCVPCVVIPQGLPALILSPPTPDYYSITFAKICAFERTVDLFWADAVTFSARRVYRYSLSRNERLQRQLVHRSSTFVRH